MPPAERLTPRRVLVTLDAVGGVLRHALDLARGLSEAGVETLLVGFGPEPSAAQRAEAAAIARARLLWRPEPLDWTTGDLAALDPIGPALDALAEAHDVDALHLNLPSQARGIESRRPIVVVAHSCLPTWWAAVRGGEPPGDFAAHRALNRAGFDRADATATPTRAHARALEEAYGPIERLVVVPNAARPARPRLGPKAEAAVAVGRWWDEAKGAATLDAAAALAMTPVRAIGPLAGPNGTLARLDYATAEGPLAAEATRAALAGSAIFVSTALYEPFGLAALEAALEGCALVLSDIPTFRELWGAAALFAAPGDALAFARSIDALGADPDAAADLAERARARAERFAVARQVDAFLDLYAGRPAAADPVLAP